MTTGHRRQLLARPGARRALLLVGMLATAGLVLTLGVVWTDVLFLAPGLVLAAVLAFGRYPGEQAIAAGRSALQSWRGTRRAMRWSAPRERPVVLARGSALIARCLAGRGPPAVRVGAATP